MRFVVIVVQQESVTGIDLENTHWIRMSCVSGNALVTYHAVPITQRGGSSSLTWGYNFGKLGNKAL